MLADNLSRYILLRYDNLKYLHSLTDLAKMVVKLTDICLRKQLDDYRHFATKPPCKKKCFTDLIS